MRELESSWQAFGDFLLKAQLARPAAAPYFVRLVRRFLSRPASNEPLIDQVREFYQALESKGGLEDGQVRQEEQALRIKDDVAVRVRPAGGGNRLDVRSLSRVGDGDVGTNAKRIRAYLDALRPE